MNHDAGDASRAAPSAGAEAVGGAIAAAAGYMVAGPAGAVAGAVAAGGITPPAARAVDWVITKMSGVRRRNVETLLDTSATFGGVEVEDLLARSDTSEDHAGLLSDAVTAALETSSTRKVIALARALANGLLNDAAQLDEERVIVRALADIEEPHVRVLLRLPVSAYTHSQPARPQGPKSAEDPITDSILAVLERNHLAQSNADDVADEWAQYRANQEVHDIEKWEREQGSGSSRSRRSFPHMTEPSTDVHWHRTEFGTLCAGYLQSAANAINDGTRPGGAE